MPAGRFSILKVGKCKLCQFQKKDFKPEQISRKMKAKMSSHESESVANEIKKTMFSRERNDICFV